MDTNNLAYLEDGEEVEVLQKTEHGVIVCRIYGSDDEDDPRTGDPFVVSMVYAEPPIGRKAARVKELEDAERQLAASISEKRRELREMESNEKRIKALAAKDAALGRVCDFMEGKITHYIINQYGDYQIMEALPGGGIPYKDDRGRIKGTKLLTLFGKAEGDFAWGLSQYSDGSGSSVLCEPFHSLEAAQARFQQILDGYESMPTYHLAGLVKAAQEHKLNIPPGLARRVAEIAITGAKSGVSEAEKKLAEAKTRLDAVSEQWAWVGASALEAK